MFKRTIMASQYLEKSDSAAKSEAKLNPEPSAAGLSQMGVWMKMPRYYLSASAKNPDSSVLRQPLFLAYGGRGGSEQ